MHKDLKLKRIQCDQEGHHDSAQSAQHRERVDEYTTLQHDCDPMHVSIYIDLFTHPQ